MPWLDAHLDLAYMALDGRDLRTPCEDADQACISLPALREAGVDLVFATIFSAPGPIPEADAHGWENPCRYPSSDDLDAAEKAGLCQIELYQQLEEAGELSIVRGRADLERDAALPKIVLLMEGADPIRSPQHAEQWYDYGLRLVGLTWSMGTRYAAGNAKPGPLTAAGVELVAALDDLGIIHDASHLADEALEGLLEHTRGPIVATHSNCRAIIGDNQRHLRDDHIKAIGDRGGVIGLNLFSKFLVPDGRATIDDCVAHVQHACELMGHRQGVGLGSDADGGFAANALPVDLDHPRKYGALLEALRTAGWSDADLQGFSWGNWERMLDQTLMRREVDDTMTQSTPIPSTVGETAVPAPGQSISGGLRMKALIEIGTNYCEKVRLGWPSEPDNFSLECHHENGEVRVSARIFGADGTILFELIDNELTPRSPSIYRRIGFHNGWRISDDNNREVLQIAYEDTDTPLGRARVTRINGDLFDKDGQQVCKASSNGLIVGGCPFAMG